MKNFRVSLNRQTLLVTFVLALLCRPAIAQDHQMKKMPKKATTHVMVNSADLKWMDGPDAIPAGAKFVVISGDPKKPGLFTMRAMLPDNYIIPAHWHPADEHVTVLSGTLLMGLGDKFDESKLSPVNAGGYSLLPARVNHFVKTQGETTLQLNSMGPWGITYVNPADDPRKKMKVMK